jgi:hypothetical protein
MRLGHLRDPREMRDVQRLREGAIHRVSRAEHPAIALFYFGHRVLCYRALTHAANVLGASIVLSSCQALTASACDEFLFARMKSEMKLM